MNKLTVVMYHYVRDLQNTRFPEIKGLDLNLFIEQIEYLKRSYRFVTMEEVIASVDNGTELPPKAVLLTFDDAYIDHYINVFPILDSHGIQGTFYVPVKAIREHRVLDVNKIHFILASVADKSRLIEEIKHLLEKYREEYNLESFDHYYDKLAQESRFDTADVIFIKRLLQVELTEELRGKMVDELFEKYLGIGEQAFSHELYMNETQLKHMLRSGMHIGNHGYNHYWWNHLDREQMSRELDLSIEYLRDIGVDMSNWTASYPYGSYDRQAVDLLRERGCKLAVTTEVDIASVTKENRFLVPRLDTNDIPKDRNAEPNDWYHKHT